MVLVLALRSPEAFPVAGRVPPLPVNPALACRTRLESPAPRRVRRHGRVSAFGCHSESRGGCSEPPAAGSRAFLQRVARSCELLETAVCPAVCPAPRSLQAPPPPVSSGRSLRWLLASDPLSASPRPPARCPPGPPRAAGGSSFSLCSSLPSVPLARTSPRCPLTLLRT